MKSWLQAGALLVMPSSRFYVVSTYNRSFSCIDFDICAFCMRCNNYNGIKNEVPDEWRLYALKIEPRAIFWPSYGVFDLAVHVCHDWWQFAFKSYGSLTLSKQKLGRDSILSTYCSGRKARLVHPSPMIDFNRFCIKASEICHDCKIRSNLESGPF